MVHHEAQRTLQEEDTVLENLKSSMLSEDSCRTPHAHAHLFLILDCHVTVHVAGTTIAREALGCDSRFPCSCFVASCLLYLNMSHGHQIEELNELREKKRAKLDASVVCFVCSHVQVSRSARRMSVKTSCYRSRQMMIFVKPWQT